MSLEYGPKEIDARAPIPDMIDEDEEYSGIQSGYDIAPTSDPSHYEPAPQPQIAAPMPQHQQLEDELVGEGYQNEIDILDEEGNYDDSKIRTIRLVASVMGSPKQLADPKNCIWRPSAQALESMKLTIIDDQGNKKKIGDLRKVVPLSLEAVGHNGSDVPVNVKLPYFRPASISKHAAVAMTIPPRMEKTDKKDLFHVDDEFDSKMYQHYDGTQNIDDQIIDIPKEGKSLIYVGTGAFDTLVDLVEARQLPGSEIGDEIYMALTSREAQPKAQVSQKVGRAVKEVLEAVKSNCEERLMNMEKFYVQFERSGERWDSPKNFVGNSISSQNNAEVNEVLNTQVYIQAELLMKYVILP